MRKAILVLATSVAFLVSGAVFAATGTRTATVTSAADLVTKGTLTNAAGELIVESAKSGVYIPAGASASTEVAVATRTAGTIAKTAVSTAVKTAVRANGAIVAVNGAIAAATAAVDWIQKDGSYVKKSASGGEVSSDGMYWYFEGQSGKYSSPSTGCKTAISNTASRTGRDYTFDTVVKNSEGSYICYYAEGNSKGNTYGVIYKQGSTCPQGASYDSSVGACMAAGYVSLSESDYNDLGDWVQQQDGTFVRQAAIEGCYLSVDPDACFDTVVPDRKLSGPATITGTPSTTSKTVTTTDASGNVTTGTSTTTTTPAATVTYNNNTTNNITYNTYDKSSTKNPDGSTTETTSDEGPPNVPDLTSTAFGPLDGLPADIAGTKASGSSLPFSSWFSMGGQCKEHTFQAPYIGAVTTNYCPIHEAYVRPFLYFIFSVWTVIYCFQIWRESTVRVRIA